MGVTSGYGFTEAALVILDLSEPTTPTVVGGLAISSKTIGAQVRGDYAYVADSDGGFGAMLSFEVRGGFDAAKRVVEGTRLFRLAVSLGAVESLIEQPAAMSHASYDQADRLRYGVSDGLVRLSVGLESWEDLRDDLDQALAQGARPGGS